MGVLQTMKPNRYIAIKFTLLLSVFVCVGFIAAANAGEEATKPDLPEGKQTSLGLYVTSEEAYNKWRAAPDTVKVLDVRTLEEFIYIGHAPMAWNIPLMSQTHEWDAEKEHFALKPNVEFISLVKEVAEPVDTIMVMCRSGGRSAMAVNMLAEAGFINVYNITDGVEGDKVKDTGSVFNGQRLRNGWKNSGAPWTYKLEREKIKLNIDTLEEEK